MDKIKKNIIISLIVTAIIFLAFSIYADFDSILISLEKFNWFLLPILLVLTCLNLFLRFLKWEYYLKLLKLPIQKKDSIGIFMASLSLGLTPGKMGDLIKSYMLHSIEGHSASKTIPIIFAERITDMISLVLIALLGVFIFDYGRVEVIVLILFFIFLITIISNKKLSIKIINYLEKVKIFSKYLSKIHNIYENTYVMLKPKPLIEMTILTLFAWIIECFGFYLILSNFNTQISMFWSTFTYALSIIIGAVSMLPAGIGATEGSLLYMLVEYGIPKDLAVVSTFLIRLVTLWFSIILGLIAMIFYKKRYGEKITFNLKQGE